GLMQTVKISPSLKTMFVPGSKLTNDPGAKLRVRRRISVAFPAATLPRYTTASAATEVVPPGYPKLAEIWLFGGSSGRFRKRSMLRSRCVWERAAGPVRAAQAPRAAKEDSPAFLTHSS